MESEDPFNDYDLIWLDFDGLGLAGVGREVVDGALDALAFLEEVDVLDEEIGVQGVRAVVVDLVPFFRGNGALVFVIIVVENDGYGLPKLLLEVLGEGGFSGSRASGHPDK